MSENSKKTELPDEAPSLDNEDIQLEQQVDEIIDFYKDMPDVPEDDPERKEDKPSGLLQKLPGIVTGKKKKYNSSDTDNDELHETAYGLSKKNRVILTYIITAFICLAAIGASYGIALILPINEAETEKIANELRSKDDYRSLEEEHSRVVSEATAQRESVSKKKEQVDNLEDVDNTKSELREEISKKGQDLDALNKEHDRLSNEISAIDKEVASRSGAVSVSLPAGRYTVGKDISPGKYTVVGNTSFSAATESGESKYNTTLTSSPLEVELSNGYKLKLGGTVLFTPSL